MRMDDPIELYEGAHETSRSIFWVFGQGTDWYWVRTLPKPHFPEGPFESSEAAYVNAMQCD